MMPTPGTSGWVPPNGMAAPPPRPRRRLRLLVLMLVPVLVVGGAVTAAALLIPPPTTPGEASASPDLIASRSETTTTTTTPPPTTSKPAPNTRVVKTKDGKSELTVPRHWRKAKKLKGLKHASLKIGNTARRQFVIVLSADKRNFSGFGEFKNLVHNATRANLKNVRVKNRRKLTVNGMPAVRWHLAGNAKGMRFVYWDTAVRGEKAFYKVIGFTTPSHTASAGPVIRRVLDSFRETAIDI